MMRVHVEIGFSFKRELPDDYRELVLPDGADVATALRALADRHPVLRDRIYSPTGDVRRDVSLLVNGGNAARRSGLATALRDGDRLTLLPPVGGG
jgi:molybdopterin converting factor small subunit